MKRELVLAVKAVGYYSNKSGLISQTESFETVVKRDSQFYSVHELVKARSYFDGLLQARSSALSGAKKRSTIAAFI